MYGGYGAAIQSPKSEGDKNRENREKIASYDSLSSNGK